MKLKDIAPPTNREMRIVFGRARDAISDDDQICDMDAVARNNVRFMFETIAERMGCTVSDLLEAFGPNLNRALHGGATTVAAVSIETADQMKRGPQ